MNVFDEFHEGRAGQSGAEDRRRAAEAWQIAGGRPAEVRLLAFDRWARLELAARLDWAWAGQQRERRIEQCRIRLEQVVLDLWRRGWMLDGKRLARRITDLLDAVGAYQRKGAVRDFWIYFGTAVDRYVGLNAEEIQTEAMRAGSQMRQLLGALSVRAVPEEPALPELLAKRREEIDGSKALTLREKLARERARQGPGSAQRELF